jgi:hypothetical protein
MPGRWRSATPSTTGCASASPRRPTTRAPEGSGL